MNSSLRDEIFALADNLLAEERKSLQLSDVEKMWCDKYGIPPNALHSYPNWLPHRPSWLPLGATRIDRHTSGRELWLTNTDDTYKTRIYFTIMPSENQKTIERIAAIAWSNYRGKSNARNT